MRPISITDPQKPGPGGTAILALGFRPFFLAAGAAAVVLMASWLVFYVLGLDVGAYYGAMAWHGHEMVFGYAVAVIAGFLLTAVRNWTGVPTARGALLLGLVALWLAGRVVPFTGMFVPPEIIAAVDLAFLPFLALAVFVPVYRAGQGRNVQFPVILLALAGANALTHPAFGLGPEWQSRGLWFAVGLIAVVITVMGGRVIPFFIERAVPGASPASSALLDGSSIVSVILVALAWLLFRDHTAAALLAVAAGLLNGWRLLRWHAPGLWREPLLWVLYLGYGWLVAGLLLQGAAGFGLLSPFIALHALTAGGIGVLTLGMMPRVSLGHTGREMRAPGGLPAAFVLINLAALARTAGPAIFPFFYTGWITAAGLLWITAFAIFLALFATVLSRPRADGRPDQ